MTIPRKDPLDTSRKEPNLVPARSVTPQKLKENATDADSLKGKPISTNPPGVGHALIYDGEEYVPQPVPSGSGGGGAGTVAIEDEGAAQGDASIINFTGAGVSATVAAGEATVTISGGGGGGHTIRENGVDQTARTGLNFIDADAGAGLITDDAGGDETEVNLNLYGLKSGIQNSTYTYAADAGISDAYAITLTPAPAAYATGQMFLFRANTLNSGPATLNVNGLGAKDIHKWHNTPLLTGDIETNQIVLVVYDGTEFQMLSREAAAIASHSLGDHADVTLAVPADGEYLRFEGGVWQDSAILAADVPTTHTSGAVTTHHAQSHDHSAAGDGTALVPASINDTGTFQLSGDTAVTWAARTDDYDPGTNSIIRVSLTGSQTLTGVSGGSDGRILIIRNDDAVDTLTIEDLSGFSAASNRFDLNGNMELATDEGAVFFYNSTTGFWCCFGRYSASAGGGGHTIQDDDAAMTARTNLSFQDGFVLTDDAGASQTEVDLSYGAAGYPVDVTTSEADGTAITVARSDHQHKYAATSIRNAEISTTAAIAESKLALTRCFYAVIDPRPQSTSTAKLSIPMPFAGTFVKVTIKTIPGETCGATAQIVDIHKQTAANENTDTSTTVFPTTGNRPQIASSAKAGSHTFSGGGASPNDDVMTFAAGDWLYIFSDQLGLNLSAVEVKIEVTQP